MLLGLGASLPGLTFSLLTCAVRVLFEGADAVLNALLKPFEALRRSKLRADWSGAEKPSVVIVGASFAGLFAQRALCDTGRFDVTLIDPKKYFEYTPGCLRLFVEPSHVYAIARPLVRERCAYNIKLE